VRYGKKSVLKRLRRNGVAGNIEAIEKHEEGDKKNKCDNAKYAEDDKKTLRDGDVGG